MTNKKHLILVMVVTGLCMGCNSKKKLPVSSADFALGKINMISTVKQNAGVHELTLMTRFALKKNNIGPDLNTYFQYQLGGKIMLLIEKDTIKPALFYYIPLVNELEKEIDCKYILQAKDLDKPKSIIINDSILDFNKVAISLK
jgi:hypothetical protein